ncbi:hypothetical protein D5018_20740 [Parashewanella curva]|uniref:Uncharacterized protein n=1 Tax=Parashewanella curva TaxID=2338552 RepID=A0A3L8PRE6_9GAMM|nr:hypothetical protein [Parashewanella curva]RLV57784.1 hypothetical protein D5018_20740 [Parashewanella curva]
MGHLTSWFENNYEKILSFSGDVLVALLILYVGVKVAKFLTSGAKISGACPRAG